MDEILAASVARDGWSWLQFGFAILAGITGFVVFIPWALERRRRPEARFLWKFSENGRLANLEPWEPNRIPKLQRGHLYAVEAAIQNVGDIAGDDGLINFVVPDCFELILPSNPDSKPAVSTNETAGIPP